MLSKRRQPADERVLVVGAPAYYDDPDHVEGAHRHQVDDVRREGRIRQTEQGRERQHGKRGNYGRDKRRWGEQEDRFIRLGGMDGFFHEHLANIGQDLQAPVGGRCGRAYAVLHPGLDLALQVAYGGRARDGKHKGNEELPEHGGDNPVGELAAEIVSYDDGALHEMVPLLAAWYANRQSMHRNRA